MFEEWKPTVHITAKDLAEHNLKRRKAWEATQTPEQIKAADAERLARLRLKFRLKGHVEKARHLKEAIENEASSIHYALEKLERRRRIAAMGFVQKKRAKNRKQTRCVQLAHSFMRGTAYARAEQSCWVRPDWPRVTALVLETHATPEALQRFEQWYQAALAHLRTNFKGVEPSAIERFKALERKRNKLQTAIAMFQR